MEYEEFDMRYSGYSSDFRSIRTVLKKGNLRYGAPNIYPRSRDKVNSVTTSFHRSMGELYENRVLFERKLCDQVHAAES